MRDRRFCLQSRLAALVLACVCCSTIFAVAALAADQDLKTLKDAEQRSRAVAQRIRAATVGIINPSLAGAGEGEGSGVIVSEDGLIVTVGHVLGKTADELTVVFPDGRRVTAKALGADFTHDAGMARITEPGKWPHVELGKSASLKPGDWCLALGHPGGIQLGRKPPIRLGRILSVPTDADRRKFIRTDATVISGDSGGPLFDLDGKVIGVNSNIGMDPTYNQHVPIDLYVAQWDDLVHGKRSGELVGMRGGPGPNAPDVAKFLKMMRQRLKAGDPEAKALAASGRMTLTPEKMSALIDKWEKADKAAANDKKAAVTTETAHQDSPKKEIDVLEFQRLMQERLVAGDGEVRKLIHDGHMMLSMEQMQDLLRRWKDPSAAAVAKGAVSPAQAKDDQALKLAGGNKELRDLLKKATPKGGGQYELKVEPSEAPKVMDLLRGMGAMMGVDSGRKSGKASKKFLGTLSPVVAQASRSTVTVQCDGKPAVFGTVVRNDGLILTKASALKNKITCKIDGKELPATIVKSRSDYDLALLKVDAHDLPAIRWADGKPLDSALSLGSWLLAAEPDGKAIGVGIVSVDTRPIPKSPTMLMRNRAVIGCMLDPFGVDGALIGGIAHGGPAEKCGLKAGDLIKKIDGQAVDSSEAARKIIGKHFAGDTLKLEVARDGKSKTFSLALAPSESIASPVGSMSDDHIAQLSKMGGTISGRRSDFPEAFEDDIVLQADQCGGPLLDLNGQAVGLNIARADRTASYAIPVPVLKPLLADLLAAADKAKSTDKAKSR